MFYMVNVHSIITLGVLDTIASVVSSIGNFLQSIGEFVVTWFRDVITITGYLRGVFSLIFTTDSGNGLPILLFPTIVVHIFTAIITIVILYKVLGREG